MLTVKELKIALETYDENAVVVMSKDGEGNSFSPLAGIENYIYVPETTYYGEIYLPELTQKLIDQGYEEEDVYQGQGDGVRAIVLWPTN